MKRAVHIFLSYLSDFLAKKNHQSKKKCMKNIEKPPIRHKGCSKLEVRQIFMRIARNCAVKIDTNAMN